MDYIKARTYIDESHRFGGEMGLEAITCLLEKLGNPHEALQFIHIAGTNGKGSVGAYLAAVLQEAGYRIGRFISPTLYEYRERIQINGVYIEEEAFGRLMDPVVKAIGELEEEHKPLPSPFEIETAISFLYYKEKKCDFVLLECGMGGKTDATNVIRNTKLAVITSISMDHMGFLGSTLREIAEKKAGIIKKGCPMITVKQKPEAEAAVMNDLRAHFRPEFLNRLDEIIMFKPLTKDNIGGIVDLLMAELNNRLADQEIHIRLTAAAKNHIIEGGYDPVYGARPLKRYLQKYVETLAAKMILGGKVGQDDTIVLDVTDGELTASVQSV